MARTAAQRDELAALEYLVDRHMAVSPFSALCAYNLTELGDAAGELICLHPYVADDTTAFRLFADIDTEQGCVVSGEIDAASTHVFGTTLSRVWPLTEGREIHVDATGLEFIGQRQLRLVDELAGRHGQQVVLLTDRSVAGRLVEVLRLQHVRVQRP